MIPKTDYYKIENHFTEEQLLIQQSSRDWVNMHIKPVIENHYQKGNVIEGLQQSIAEIGGFGLIIPTEYGGFGGDFISFGLMMQEFERGDTSVRVMSSIQTSLVMYAIWKFGTDKQKEYYLPKLAIGEFLGAFALTEPNYGSNPQSMHSYYKEKGDNIVLNGSKLWIGNATKADVIIVWAKNEQGEIQGILLDTNQVDDFVVAKIPDKLSFRASITGELSFYETEISNTQLLPKAKRLKNAYECLNIGRYAISWGCIGIATDCYETALTYSKEREQFGKPIASFQLIQKKLAEMITEITKAQLLSYQLGVLMNEGKATYQQISMAKRSNVQMARMVAREARQILGGMGITSDYSVMRHIMNLETLVTYQGTHEMHLLITGEDITSISAFY